MHKYTTTFDFEVTACQEIGGVDISKANIENLRDLIPSSVNLEKNIDLMGVAFNAAVVNEFNKNIPPFVLVFLLKIYINPKITETTAKKKVIKPI